MPEAGVPTPAMRAQAKKMKKLARRVAPYPQHLLAAPRQTIGGQTSIPWRNVPAKLIAPRVGRTELVVEKTEALTTQVLTGASGALNIQTFVFHTGTSELSWLRNMANSFVEWQLLGLEYTYVPSVPTTQAGSVTIAIKGDYLDGTPTSQAEVQRYDLSVSAPVYAGMDGGSWINQWGLNHPNTIGVTMPDYMYKFGTQPRTYRVVSDSTFNAMINTDKNDYSPGALVVATSGTGINAGSVGTVFVRYRVRLLGSVAISTAS